MAFPTKTSVFGRFSSRPPRPTPLKRANFIFVVVSPPLIYENFFVKFARTSACFPVTWVRSPRSLFRTKQLVQMNFFILNGSVGVGFPRAELKVSLDKHRTNRFQRRSAIFCENLCFLAGFCKNLRFWDAAIPRKSANLQRSAKICEEPRIWLRLSLLVCPF